MRNRSLPMLEKALIHLLNEEQDEATRIFHQFIVSTARQIHESLRTGDESVLAEGWDDEIASEEYFSEADLADAEDGAADDAALPDADPMSAPTAADSASTEGDMTAADAVDDLSADLGGDDMDGDDMGGDVASDVADIKDQLEKLTAEFEQMMASLDVDGDGEHTAADHEMEGDAETTDNFDFEGEDEGGETDGDATTEEGGDEEATADEDAEGSDEDEKVDESMDFSDITESVLAELEKVSANLSDGKEVGDGKAVSQNNASPIPQKGVNSRQGAKPVFTKAEEHKGFERETAPAVKDMPKRKNVRSTAEQGNSPVKAPAAKKEGSLAADGSTVKVNPKMTAAPPQAKSVR